MTSATPFIWSSVLLKHDTYDSILSFFFFFFLGKYHCLFISRGQLLSLCMVPFSCWVPWTASLFSLFAKSDRFSSTCSTYVFILLLFNATFTIFTLARFNQWPNRSLIWGWFIVSKIYIFLDITITGINIECYIFHPPWICFNAGFIRHTYNFLVDDFCFSEYNLSLTYRIFVKLPRSVIHWLIWKFFLMIDDFVAVLFLSKVI